MVGAEEYGRSYLPRRKIKRPRAAGAWSWAPKLILVIMFFLGVLVWIMWAYIRQMQLVWIPETDFWHRLGTCMKDVWYIPVIFWVAGVMLFILLEKKQ